jgi:hypothetical protein
VPASGRVSLLAFPRNEGVPGSSPGVGFSRVCRAFFCLGNGGGRLPGTKRVHLLTVSCLMKGSLAALICRHLQVGLRVLARLPCALRCPRVPASACECPHVPGVLPWLSSLRDRANQPSTLAGLRAFARDTRVAVRKFRVAWIQALSATLLLTTAGATWGPIVRRRTPASRPQRASAEGRLRRPLVARSGTRLVSRDSSSRASRSR